MSQSEGVLLTAAQVAALAQVSEHHVSNLVNRGDLKGIWFGRSLRIRAADLAEFIQAGGAKPRRNELNTYRRRAAGGKGRR